MRHNLWPFFSLFFSFFFHTCNMWKFPGQGSNPCCSDDPSHCSDNAGSLTSCAARERLYIRTLNAVCASGFSIYFLFSALCGPHQTVCLLTAFFDLIQDRTLTFLKKKKKKSPNFLYCAYEVVIVISSTSLSLGNCTHPFGPLRADVHLSSSLALRGASMTE